jgi:hypothetical protein
VILPDLQVLPGGARDVEQAAAFQAVEVHAPILSDVVQVLRANPIQQWVAQLDAAGNPPTLMMWRALPVHPKTAVLFFWGIVAPEALLLAFALYQGLPLMDQVWPLSYSWNLSKPSSGGIRPKVGGIRPLLLGPRDARLRCTLGGVSPGSTGYSRDHTSGNLLFRGSRHDHSYLESVQHYYAN